MAISTNIIEIHEFTLAAGLTDIVYTTSGTLPNALIGIYCDAYGVYPSNMYKEGNSIHITYDPQTVTIHVAMIFFTADFSVINTLESTSETDALSAYQGKVLKDLIDNMGTPALSELTDIDFTSLSDGDIIVYDLDSQKFVNIEPLLSTLHDVNISSPANGDTLIYDNGEWKNVPSPSNVNYSTSEQNTGLKWIDNKTIYQKTVDIGSLPNNTHKLVAHGISDLDEIIQMIGFARTTSGTFTFIPLPYATQTTTQIVALSAIDKTNIRISTGQDRSGLSGYVTMLYTKTS